MSQLQPGPALPFGHISGGVQPAVRRLRAAQGAHQRLLGLRDHGDLHGVDPVGQFLHRDHQRRRVMDRHRPQRRVREIIECRIHRRNSLCSRDAPDRPATNSYQQTYRAPPTQTLCEEPLVDNGKHLWKNTYYCAFARVADTHTHSHPHPHPHPHHRRAWRSCMHTRCGGTHARTRARTRPTVMRPRCRAN